MEEKLRKQFVNYAKEYLKNNEDEAKILTDFFEIVSYKKYQSKNFEEFNSSKVELFLNDFAKFLDEKNVKNKFEVYIKIKEDLTKFDEAYLYINFQHLNYFLTEK